MADFCIERRVYYHDTDAGGVVYYGNYLKHLEEGRTEFCLDRGVDPRALKDSGIVFPVVHTEIDYKSPARYMDLIQVCTRVEKIGTASIQFLQEITRDGQLLVKALTVWACVGKDFRAAPVPEDTKKKLLA
jgi:acyl-CoA thioester hydrolase